MRSATLKEKKIAKRQAFLLKYYTRTEMAYALAKWELYGEEQ